MRLSALPSLKAIVAAAVLATMASGLPAHATDNLPGGGPGGIHTITKDKAKILSLLKGSGWVSPHLKGKPLWMVSFRSCPDCIRFEKEEFPDLHKANVDTRVIVIARRAKSTAPERTGVAELWAKRDWKMYEDWTSIPVDAFTGEGLPSGDADPTRAALVERGRVFIDQLGPLLKENGLEMHYPTLIWTNAKGQVRGCSCEEHETYTFMRQDFGLPG